MSSGVVAFAAGAAFVGGLAACIVALMGRLPSRGRSRDRLTANRRVLWGAGAAAAGLFIWLVTGWWAAGVLAAGAVVVLPLMIDPGREARQQLDRMEALEEWVRRLADLMDTGRSLEQSIATSTTNAPPSIRGPVDDLAFRLNRRRWPTEAALRQFAEDLNTTASDLVAAALIKAATRRGPGVPIVLESLAANVGEYVAMQRRIEADRAEPRTNARWVTIITTAAVGYLALKGNTLDAYADGQGQVALVVFGGGFLGCLAWMYAMTKPGSEPRFVRPRPNVPVGDR